MSRRDVVYISSIDWSFLWQVHQEIAIRLARAGDRVFYVENTGVRAPGPGDARRVAARLGNWAAAAGKSGWRTVAPSILAHAPLVLPPFSGSLARQINRRVLLPRLHRSARGLGLGDERLVFTFLPTDTALDMTAAFTTPRSVLVYYCLADFEQLTPHPGALRESERDLLERADLVFANSPLMVRRCRRVRDDVHLFPPGIDLEAFPSADIGSLAPPISPEDAAALAALPRPVLGYVGGLHRFVDFALLEAIARLRPDVSLVLVGPRQGVTGLTSLTSLPNVHLLGERPHDRLAGIIARFDVGLIPYLLGPATDSVMPIKLNEYLAMGRPVAATALPPLVELAGREDVVAVAPGEPSAFLGAIERALAAGDDPAARRRRRRVAALADWQAQFAAMSALIDARFAKLAADATADDRRPAGPPAR